ncbi:double-strand break repair helicase AddA [Shimia sp. MMG029]|uniref:double-strand break repair helicase AddA n=1 Tax=Shimia sp. MMG029 TaxID=3021978 RepID=UPI0022FF3832|nr:double-strand break repair helicase AddA [Shimia sp. MMG029]MDA5557351.1 double-strand break repair helicase AddA [Shimia sp. MMG029]
MNAPASPPNDATLRQITAARPDASTWLSANAGSGKTRVLTDRVARLLLEGVLPQHILCLTYTKAAASEMQNRLFKRLGSWAMKSDAELAEELAELGVVGKSNADDLRQARTLFARAIETPGGLKIQTIHSFCASLLRRFPLEAGVSPLFSEMEDRAAALLREDIVEAMAESEDAPLLRNLAVHFTGAALEDLTADITRHADRLRHTKDTNELGAMLGLPDGYDQTQLLSEAFLGGEMELLTNLISVLRTGGTNDNRAADKLSAISAPNLSALEILETVLLNGRGAKSPFSAKLDSFPTKGMRTKHVDLMYQLEPLMLRIEDVRPRRIALRAMERSAALQAFSAKFLERYDKAKQQRGWLDFDDLILRARNLLNEPAVAEWVLYRLDGGIDHILVDEAQDTSPVQWQVIERLAQEFTSGTGARSDVTRTIFVVGDQKQSIYSFQGADPAEFDRMREEFAARLQPTGNQLQNLSLEYSFRSSPAVLNLVDTCFENHTSAGFPQGNRHIAFNDDMPGRVDLWPVVEPVGKAEKDEWFDPVDRLGDTHHTVILAERVAAQIKRMIVQDTIADSRGPDGKFTQRAIQPGDFLILVQRRSDLFHEIIRACKLEGLPIAGADRLKVGGEMAVRDLGALLSFLATPEDDLSLATVLRSPLLGWSEQELFDLAHRRTPGSFLWTALRDRGTEFPATMAMLDDMRGQTDFLRPYDLIERILTRHKGRHALLARLGAEAEDGINALLSQALAYEKSSVPSLTGFLQWMETDDLEIKRQMDSASNRIRVMTVHGSKGLEAPIVIMPDTGKRLIKTDAPIVPVDQTALWNMSADAAPDILANARADMAEAQAAERLRLLYVAMTRAEKWLIVAAAGDLGKDGNSWYDIVRSAMTASNAAQFKFQGGEGLRLSHGDWSGAVSKEAEKAEEPDSKVPDYLRAAAQVPDLKPTTISPSDLGGAKALAGDQGLDQETAMQRGTWLHLLLEHLPTYPQPQWDQVAESLLQDDLAEMETGVFAQLLKEAKSNLTSAALEWIFAPDALAEVPITADLGTHRLHGIIDRLIIQETCVWAIDLKTNAVVPNKATETPDGILKQMGAYTHALEQVFPGKKVHTAILWTAQAELVELPHDLVTKALRATAYLDAPQSQT